MAFKLLFFILNLYFLNALVTADEENPCICAEDPTETGKISLWDFFSEQDKKEEAGEKNPYPVIPAMLPRLPCSNCIEMNRRKRKTDEKIVADVIRQQKRSIHFSKWNCPQGYYRLGSRCFEKFIVERRFG